MDSMTSFKKRCYPQYDVFIIDSGDSISTSIEISRVAVLQSTKSSEKVRNCDVESCRIEATESKNRFYDFVRVAVDKYLVVFRVVLLLYIAGHVFRSYRLHF